MISKEEYKKHQSKLKSEISDKKDLPYIACCLHIKSEGIWSHDIHFKKQNKVKVFTNIDLLNLSR